MTIPGRLLAHLDQAQIIEIEIESYRFKIYVAQRSDDLEQVTDLVPVEQFQADGNIHVAALYDDQDIQKEIADILFNLNPGDSIVFLCTSAAVYSEVLAEFEQTPLTIHRT